MDKIKSSICLSCCFRADGVDTLAHHPSDDRQLPSTTSASTMIRTSSTWIRSKAHELPELRDKCRGFVTRTGKNGAGGGGHHHHRRHTSSADFKYDPLSYALNFDDGPIFDDDGAVSPSEFRYRDFSARLPQSPPFDAAVSPVTVAGGGR